MGAVRSTSLALSTGSKVVVKFVVPILANIASTPDYYGFTVGSFILVCNAIVFLPGDNLFSGGSDLSFDRAASPAAVVTNSIDFTSSVFSPVSTDIPVRLHYTTDIPFSVATTKMSTLHPTFVDPTTVLFAYTDPVGGARIVISSMEER